CSARGSPGMSGAPALELRQVSKRFTLTRGGLFGRQPREHVAVDRVDLTLPKNKIIALVGESGSGKTTTGLLALRLVHAPTGPILRDAEDTASLLQRDLNPSRRRMQVVSKASSAWFDRMWALGEIIAEPLAIHDLHTPAERRDHARQWLQRV